MVLAVILVAECKVEDSQVSQRNKFIPAGLKLHISNKRLYHALKFMLHIPLVCSRSKPNTVQCDNTLKKTGVVCGAHCQLSKRGGQKTE